MLFPELISGNVAIPYSAPLNEKFGHGFHFFLAAQLSTNKDVKPTIKIWDTEGYLAQHIILDQKLGLIRATDEFRVSATKDATLQDG